MAQAGVSSPTTALVDYLAGCDASRFPQRLHERAKDLLIDHLGVSYAGWDLPWSRLIRERVLREGGAREGTIYGGGRVPARGAALVNATAAHALELDDTHIPSLSHIGAVVFPAALATAEAKGLTGRDVLSAFLVGAEAMGRIGRAGGKSVLDAGFHPTSANGVFGAAAAVAHVFGADGRMLENAFGLALSMAGGVMQFSLDDAGSMVKRLHAGLAAESGVLSALLAHEGYRGPGRSIEGEYGFLRVFGRHADSSAMLQDLGTCFIADEISVKRNACCLHFGALVDALEACREGQTLDADDIERIEVSGPKALLKNHMEYRPRSTMAAQYSLPYVTAVATLSNAQDPRAFDEDAAGRADFLALGARVTAAEDAALDKLFPAQFPASARVVRKNGDVLSSTVLDAKGTAPRPLTRADIIEKFNTLTARVLPPGLRDDLLGACLALDEEGGLARLCRLLAHPLS
jgi:2-methylcitrate dehydratase PrpD